MCVVEHAAEARVSAPIGIRGFRRRNDGLGVSLLEAVVGTVVEPATWTRSRTRDMPIQKVQGKWRPTRIVLEVRKGCLGGG